MLVEFYVKRADSGRPHIDFSEEDIKKSISPEAQMREAYDARRQLLALTIDYEKAIANGRNPKLYGEGLREIRKEIREKFQYNPVARLILAIDSAENKIKSRREAIKKLKKAGGEKVALVYGHMFSNDSGGIEVRAIAPTSEIAKVGDGSQLSLPEKAANRITAILKDDFNSYSPDEFTKNLLLAVYSPGEIVEAEKNMEELEAEAKELIERKSLYESVYRQAQEAFIKTLSEAAQKLLCVKVFFDHGTIKGNDSDAFPAGLLVTNCKVSRFLADTNLKSIFTDLMKKLGSERSGKKVWLGILPDVSQKLVKKSSVDEPWEIDAPLNANTKKEEEEDGVSDVVSVDDAISALDIMNQAEILTFFNLMPNETNSFANFSPETIDRMEKELKLDEVNNPHAVLTYPNFTILGEGTIEISGERISVPAIYVGASYVAAGLTAASQRVDVLEKRGLSSSLIKDNANTRIDLENEDIIFKLPAKFTRELAYPWDPAIYERINKRNLGFVFCSYPKRNPATDKPMKNAYILQARTLGLAEGRYQPLYTTLTKDFVNAFIREYGGDRLSKQTLKELKNKFADWANEPLRGDTKGKLNLMLQSNEKIESRDG